MRDHAVAVNAPDSPARRFARIEETLWRHHGLTPTERFIELQRPRIRMRVLEVGTGATVLLVHGTVGPGSWPSLIQAMGGAGRFLVVDRPGWGGSEPLDYRRHDHRTVAADLLAGILDALRIQRATVIGGSIGNVWALSLAERDPSRVDRVVLLGGGPLLQELRPPSFIRLIASPLGALVVRLPVSRDRTRSILTDSGHGPSVADGRIPDEFLDYRVSLSNDSTAMRLERGLIRAVLDGPTWKDGFAFTDTDLRSIAAPTLMVFGTADNLGDEPTWRRFVGRLPNGRLETIAGAGHMPWFDEPAAVAGHIGQFMAGR
jgi:pimeloyl-ACP methyl ester carboxylesterase